MPIRLGSPPLEFNFYREQDGPRSHPELKSNRRNRRSGRKAPRALGSYPSVSAIRRLRRRAVGSAPAGASIANSSSESEAGLVH
jgi:hypothetical protein